MIKKIIFAVFLGLFLYQTCHAGALPSVWDDSIKNEVDNLVRTGTENRDSIGMVKALITYNVIPLFKYVFIGISILFFTLSLFMMATSGGNEDTISSHRTALLWGMLGFAFISLSAEVAEVFDPLKNSDQIADIEGTKAIVQKIISYLQLVIGVISSIFMFYAGGKFVTQGDDEDAIESAKKTFVFGLIGLAVVILADPLVNNVFYPASGKPGTEEAREFTKQIIGLVRFVLNFLAVVTFIAFVYAGYLYTTSFGDDEKHEQAKNIFIGSAIGIVLILCSYALVSTFV